MSKRRFNTWWVGYSFVCKLWDNEDEVWVEYEDIEAGRFYCLKKDIPAAVEKAIRESLSAEKIKDLEVRIYESYITTDYEV